MSTSKIRVDEITNEAGTGAPSMPFDGAGVGMAANNMTDAVSELKSNLDNFEAVPSGAVQYFAMNTPPTGWLKANGAAISRTTYSALFDAIGTTFGAGDGSTTFDLPDLRGEFLRGWDDGRGVDSGRSFGTAQGDAFQQHTHPVPSTGNYYYHEGSSTALHTTGGNTLRAGQIAAPGASGRTSTETRPRNVALLACIKF